MGSAYTLEVVSPVSVPNELLSKTEYSLISILEAAPSRQLNKVLEEFLDQEIRIEIAGKPIMYVSMGKYLAFRRVSNLSGSVDHYRLFLPSKVESAQSIQSVLDIKVPRDYLEPVLSIFNKVNNLLLKSGIGTGTQSKKIHSMDPLDLREVSLTVGGRVLLKLRIAMRRVQSKFPKVKEMYVYIIPMEVYSITSDIYPLILTEYNLRYPARRISFYKETGFYIGGSPSGVKIALPGVPRGRIHISTPVSLTGLDCPIVYPVKVIQKDYPTIDDIVESFQMLQEIMDDAKLDPDVIETTRPYLHRHHSDVLSFLV